MRLLQDLAYLKGKILLYIGVSTGILFMLLFILFYSPEGLWKIWNIPVMSPCFADFRAITSGAESYALGFDPLIENPQDPWKRQMSYPRIWQILFFAGINQNHTIYFGIIIALLYFASIFIFTPSIMDNLTVCVLMLGIFSPAVLLGVERGNIDLLVFFLLSVAICFMEKRFVISKIMSVILLLTAFALKLFPIFGAGLIIGEKRNMKIILSSAILIFAVIYFIMTYDDINLIQKALPKATILTYGMDLISMKLSNNNPAIEKTVKAISDISIFLAVLIMLYWARNKDKHLNKENIKNDKNIMAFRVGSGIYLGTFLLTVNWDYRLVFLLFVIPQLMIWIGSENIAISSVSGMTVVAILLSMWQLVIIPSVLNLSYAGFTSFFLDEIVSWIVFWGLLSLFICSKMATSR